MPDEKIEEALQMREITITLDTYDDIFSDFDPRPYSQRELSEDFIKEIQRRYMEDKRGRFEVHFTIPFSGRDAKEEALIKKRLREHFAIQMSRENEAIKSTKSRGYVYMLAGAFVLLSDAFALVVMNESSVFYRILSVLIVPAGWYGMWTGMGKVIDDPFISIEKKALYEKFEKANYIFLSDELE